MDRLVACACLALATVACSALEDELAGIVVEAKAPPRFANHVPAFEIVDEAKGVFAVHDGTRLVGRFGKGIELFVADPARANADGTGFKGNVVYASSNSFFPKAKRSVKDEATASGREARIVRTQTWKAASPDDADGSETLAMTWSCDPVLGYQCAFRREVVSDKPLVLHDKEGKPAVDKKGAPLPDWECWGKFGRGIASSWPDRWNYGYTVYTPGAADRHRPGKRFAGFANNLLAADPADGITVRNGGFIAFLPGNDGWGLSLTRSGSELLRQGSCNMWFDQHCMVHLPEQADADGKWRIVMEGRYAFLPPEVCDLITKQLEVLFAERKGVLVHLGVTEDFEDQPVSFGDTRRGLLTTQVSISEAHAHSGSRALMAKGVTREKVASQSTYTQQPGLPCAGVRSSSKYGAGAKLTCWIYVEGEGSEAFISVGPPSLDDAAVGVTRSVAVKAGAGWQQVEFDPPPLKKAMLQFFFVCVGQGTAWFDDLRFANAAKSEEDGTLAPTPVPTGP